jgi:hypothetical protein
VVSSWRLRGVSVESSCFLPPRCGGFVLSRAGSEVYQCASTPPACPVPSPPCYGPPLPSHGRPLRHGECRVHLPGRGHRGSRRSGLGLRSRRGPEGVPPPSYPSVHPRNPYAQPPQPTCRRRGSGGAWTPSTHPRAARASLRAGDAAPPRSHQRQPVVQPAARRPAHLRLRHRCLCISRDLRIRKKKK